MPKVGHVTHQKSVYHSLCILLDKKHCALWVIPWVLYCWTKGTSSLSIITPTAFNLFMLSLSLFFYFWESFLWVYVNTSLKKKKKSLCKYAFTESLSFFDDVMFNIEVEYFLVWGWISCAKSSQATTNIRWESKVDRGDSKNVSLLTSLLYKLIMD